MSFHLPEHIHIDLVAGVDGKVRFEFENTFIFFDLGSKGFSEYKCKFFSQFYSVLSKYRRDVIKPDNARGKVSAQISNCIEIELLKVDDSGDIEMTFVAKDIRNGDPVMVSVFVFDAEEMECVFQKVGEIYAEAYKEHSWQSGARISSWEGKMNGGGIDGDIELNRFKKE